jgi:Cu2+-containing amine oxidase
MTTKTKTKKVKPVLTTAAFIKQKIAEAKLDDKKILAAARKRAPKQKIGDHYVSWYRWQAKKDSHA